MGKKTNEIDIMGEIEKAVLNAKPGERYVTISMKFAAKNITITADLQTGMVVASDNETGELIDI